ncbi:MAG: metallophosphoesterase family protein [Halieaceae bacterium]|uniref:metallophosphoesterase family protein n=1 Tax=Haliea alexandrii TaxID=2448162 RepID=UPI000F0BC421|nr:metallophosphoesterase [Haliea alexandrii]MCR9186802.1 metallophosphoesterase family protein [Halieaceae bacterium]
MIRYSNTLMAAAMAALLAGCSDGSDQVAEVLPPPNPCDGTEVESSRLFLQQLTSSSVIIKWRGDATAACIGSSAELLATRFTAEETEGDHKEVRIDGLEAGSTYYYSVGGAPSAPAGQQFTTAPARGTAAAGGKTRLWVIGDSGTGGDDEREGHEGEAAEVLAGLEAFVEADGKAVDLFLMLGDNAYNVGSDFNYQQAVFETYPDLLKSVSLWPTIGNHEMGLGFLSPTLGLPGLGTSADPDSYQATADDEPGRMPYLDIFSLPAEGEAGGVASGTEQYYSFDHGNVHVVSLDSQLSARDPEQMATMREWLIDDLSSNDLDWTVVIFHHPPYSKGANHDSDDVEKVNGFDRPQRDMREQFVPIFDAHGVDLVYNGHSHSYERSYYITSHTGTSDTFSTAEHAELLNGDPAQPASGRGDMPYAQLSPTSGGVDDRVIYSVVGNSGKADEDAGSLTAADEWLRHPAHIDQPADTEEPPRRGLPVLGSAVIDASDTELTHSFITVDGEVLDQFTITR